jgi:hypothetical protein
MVIFAILLEVVDLVVVVDWAVVLDLLVLG